ASPLLTSVMNAAPTTPETAPEWHVDPDWSDNRIDASEAAVAAETTAASPAALTGTSEPAPPVVPLPTSIDSKGAWDRARPLLTLVWLAGSLACLALTAIRLTRFQRWLKSAWPASPGLAAAAGHP